MGTHNVCIKIVFVADKYLDICLEGANIGCFYFKYLSTKIFGETKTDQTIRFWFFGKDKYCFTLTEKKIIIKNKGHA